MNARDRRHEAPNQHGVVTLADVVAAVSDVTSDEIEVVAVVLHMLRRRSIRPIGTVSSLDVERARRGLGG
jgi:hypothetical protein